MLVTPLPSHGASHRRRLTGDVEQPVGFHTLVPGTLWAKVPKERAPFSRVGVGVSAAGWGGGKDGALLIPLRVTRGWVAGREGSWAFSRLSEPLAGHYRMCRPVSDLVPAGFAGSENRPKPSLACIRVVFKQNFDLAYVSFIEK